MRTGALMAQLVYTRGAPEEGGLGCTRQGLSLLLKLSAEWAGPECSALHARILHTATRSGGVGVRSSKLVRSKPLPS